MTFDFGDSLRWRKSSRSTDQGGNCLYTADGDKHTIGVRDSKEGLHGRPLWCSSSAWSTFVAAVKAGNFDDH